MKERPMIFSGPEVRAILEGRKTQTRRVMKPQPLCPDAWGEAFLLSCPYGQTCDHLWVRETWEIDPVPDGGVCPTLYRADVDAEGYTPCGTWVGGVKWRPSIHMPRWASRITLEVVSVRVERLQAISEEDAISEGAFKKSKVGDDPMHPLWSMTADGWRYEGAREAFAAFWDSQHRKRLGCTWGDNPWVWVVDFKQLELAD